MFCSNCGKPLADGAKFCSNCGAQVAAPMTSTIEERTHAPAEKPAARPSYDMAWGAQEPVSKPKKAAERKVSFDWSSVIDENHKKPRVEVRSPWDTDGYDEVPAAPSRRSTLEDEVFADATASRNTSDRGRTLTFIDILKQEREENERKAYEAARRIEDDVRVSAYDAPIDSNSILPEDERIVTRGYTDLKKDIVAEMESKPAGTDFDRQLAGAKERRSGRTPLFTPEPPRSFVDNFVPDPAAKAAAPHAVKPEQTIEDELTSILEEGQAILDEPEVEVPAAPAAPEPEFDVPEVPAAEDLFSDELEVETPAEEVAEPEDAYDFYMDYVPRGRAARHRYEEEEDDDDDDEDLISEDEEVPAEEPAESVDAVDDEIAELQRKLEMLLGKKNGTIPAEEPAAPARPAAEEVADEVADEYISDDFFDAELTNEEADEVEIADVTAEVPEVAEVVAEESYDDLAAVAEPAAEDQTFDDDPAMSIEALLNDLLPAEATTDVTPVAAEYELPEEELTLDDLDSAIDSVMADIGEAPAPAAPVAEPTVEDLIIDTPVSDDIVDIDAELAKLGFGLEETMAAEEPAYNEADMLFTHETTAVADTTDTVAISTSELAKQEAMSIEELEKDIFGPAADDAETEATKKIEKFYTLYRKNEEFQKLLDAEYDKLNGTKFDGPSPEDEILASEPDLSDLEALVAAPIAEPAKPATPAPAEPAAEPAPVAPAPIAEEPAKPEKKNAKADKKAEKKAAKAAKKAEKAAKKQKAAEEFDDDEGKGGGILTVLAIIVALLLVVLLVIILVLNFAPDSGIAQTLNDVIGNFTSFLASNDNTELLL